MKKLYKYFFIFLWLMIWSTYNTNMFIVLGRGLPQNIFDLARCVVVFLPFVAMILAGISIFRNKNLPKNFFLTPLGLLAIYAIVGLVSSIFSKYTLQALYYDALYLSVILVLLAVLAGINSAKKLSLIIKFNWAIAGVLALVLMSIFLVQPGIVKSLTYNFLICNQRPYESMGSIIANAESMGIFGTRPTGFGRYAGVAAILALVEFLCATDKTKKKIIWLFLFILFLFILFFSKGRTEIIGFLVAMIFVVWLVKKINVKLILGICLIFVISILSIFLNVPCSNNIGTTTLEYVKASPKLSEDSGIQFKANIVTLSGRTNGVWTDAWHLFWRNPLLGFGFEADRFFLSDQHAHNALVQSLVQTGLLGTIPLVLAFILALIYLYKSITEKGVTEKEKCFLIGLAGVFAFFAVRAITESTGAYFDADWLFLAPIIAYASLVKTGGKKDGTSYEFLGNKISITPTGKVVEIMSNWIKSEKTKTHWIVATGMHGVVEAEKHASFKHVVSRADLFVPDGISLVWIAKLKGFNIKKRVSGADLMQEFFKNKKEFDNYFYGDTENTLAKMAEKFPNLKITGSYSPPFRELTNKEDEEIIEKINKANPDVLWVGLGLPKQEIWIYKHKDKLKVPVIVGVGAAFKFLSGNVKRAPKWIGDLGFEWLWRLFLEPKRMWRRVFLDGPLFVWFSLLDLSGLNRYK